MWSSRASAKHMNSNKRRRLEILGNDDEWHTFEPESKRQADPTQIDGVIQTSLAILLHVDAMANVVEYLREGADIARLKIALARFWPSIASRVSRLKLGPGPKTCCAHAVHMSCQFPNLTHLKIKYLEKDVCIGTMHVNDANLKPLPPSLLSLNAMHLSPLTIAKMLGPEERPALQSVSVKSYHMLNSSTWLQSIRFKANGCMDKDWINEISVKFPNLVTLYADVLIHSIYGGATATFDMSRLTCLRSLALYTSEHQGNLSLLCLPTQLEELVITPDALARLPPKTVLSRLQKLFLYSEFGWDEDELVENATPRSLALFAPNLQYLDMNCRINIFLRVFELSAEFLLEMANLQYISGDLIDFALSLVARFISCKGISETRVNNIVAKVWHLTHIRRDV